LWKENLLFLPKFSKNKYFVKGKSPKNIKFLRNKYFVNPARTAPKRLDTFSWFFQAFFFLSLEKFIKPFQRYSLLRKRKRGTSHFQKTGTKNIILLLYISLFHYTFHFRKDMVSSHQKKDQVLFFYCHNYPGNFRKTCTLILLLYISPEKRHGFVPPLWKRNQVNDHQN
jgi:hypothetical protein